MQRLDRAVSRYGAAGIRFEAHLGTRSFRVVLRHRPSAGLASTNPRPEQFGKTSCMRPRDRSVEWAPWPAGTRARYGRADVGHVIRHGECIRTLPLLLLGCRSFPIASMPEVPAAAHRQNHVRNRRENHVRNRRASARRGASHPAVTRCPEPWTVLGGVRRAR